MPILAGPQAGLGAAINAMARSYTAEPFSDSHHATHSAKAAAVDRILALLEKLVSILEKLDQPMKHEMPDDFMKGWGEPGGEMD